MIWYLHLLLFNSLIREHICAKIYIDIQFRNKWTNSPKSFFFFMQLFFVQCNRNILTMIMWLEDHVFVCVYYISRVLTYVRISTITNTFTLNLNCHQDIDMQRSISYSKWTLIRDYGWNPSAINCTLLLLCGSTQTAHFSSCSPLSACGGMGNWVLAILQIYPHFIPPIPR